MPSTYSTNLRFELMATGEKSGTWGTISNTNIGTLIEQAISGVASVTHDDSASYSLTTGNGTTDEARNAVVNVTGTLTAARNLVVPSVDKLYVIKNSTSGGFNITVKTSAGTGVVVENGNTKVVFCDAANVEEAITEVDLNKMTANLLDVDNIRIDGNTISSTDTNGNVTVDPNGTGQINLSANVDVTGTVTFDGGTTSADLNFGDNDKAIFGAGSDLQIYHDGSNSYIKDGGTGELRFELTDIGRFRNGTTFETLLYLDSDAGVTAYYNGAAKLETTNTGIDVTGTVTADGLTVQNASAGRVLTGIFQNTTNSAGTSSGISLRNSADTTSVNLTAERVGSNAGADLVITGFDNAGVEKNFMRITEGNDISFYDSTGVTQGLFWDASTQRLGLGTTSPQTALDLAGEINFSGLTASFPSPSQPRLYRSGSSAGSYPFNNFGHLVIQARGDGSNRDIVFATGTAGANKTVIDSSGNVGIGTSSPDRQLHVKSSNATVMQVESTNASIAQMTFVSDGAASNPTIGATDDTAFNIQTGNNERLRIHSNGALTLKTTQTNPYDTNQAGLAYGHAGDYVLRNTGTGSLSALFNQQTEGSLLLFAHAGTTEGSVSISGTTVSYNGGHIARWSQATDGNRIDGLVKGTVMTNLDQMAVWHHEAQPATYYEEGDELPEGVSVGDEKTPAVDAYDEDNEQLNCMAVSSVEGDANVAGVFVNWDDDDEDYTADMNVAMTGDMVIRIAQGTTVARGDLLMSAGDGTAKPQGDDIVRSKTIAKVTSTTVSHTYDDGSYLVPCVLMAC